MGKDIEADGQERGWEIVRSRWIDINKGDDLNPNYRSRMVGKEFNDSELDGLFAATPPLEALRLLLSWAATDGSAHPGGARQGRLQKSLLIADVSMAFFEATAKRDQCVGLHSMSTNPEIHVVPHVRRPLPNIYIYIYVYRGRPF